MIQDTSDPHLLETPLGRGPPTAETGMPVVRRLTMIRTADMAGYSVS